MSSRYASSGGKSFGNSDEVLTRKDNRYYAFGPFRIGSAERLLRRGGEVVPLPPKAVDTLLILAESGGRVVGKDELIQRIWPDTFVEEGGLARNISLLRKVLGEDPDYI